MASDWQQFLKTSQALTAARSAEAIWSLFEAQALVSREAPLLAVLLRACESLEETHRAGVAVVIARLLVDAEWGGADDAARAAFVRALGELSREADPNRNGSFADLVTEGAERELVSLGTDVLKQSRQMLALPCRRSEVRYVAGFCNLGVSQCMAALRRALRTGKAADARVADARVMFMSAFAQYANGARAMNNVAGAVVFSGLDATLS